MPYLRTRLATNFPEKRSFGEKFIRVVLFFIPRAIPDYEPKLHLVREWVVECGESGEPWREVGLDATGEPVVSGPDDWNYGFWCDTNAKREDLKGEPITREEFEEQWRRAAHLRQGEVSSATEQERNTG